MDILILFVTLIAGLASLAMASIRWGADSRDRIADDHRR